MKTFNFQQFLGQTLRIGVFTASLVAIIGGTFYLIAHGGDTMPDYTKFSPQLGAASYTSILEIYHGVLSFKPLEIIQFAVCLLILTPIMRVALSLFGFVIERDWLYVIITFIVLFVIFSNLFEGK